MKYCIRICRCVIIHIVSLPKYFAPRLCNRSIYSLQILHIMMLSCIETLFTIEPDILERLRKFMRPIRFVNFSFIFLYFNERGVFIRLHFFVIEYFCFNVGSGHQPIMMKNVAFGINFICMIYLATEQACHVVFSFDRKNKVPAFLKIHFELLGSQMVISENQNHLSNGFIKYQRFYEYMRLWYNNSKLMLSDLVKKPTFRTI